MILQLIEGTQIPEFDNLYLDMNSIFHNCTHGNDDDISKRLSEEEVFARIFTYIDHLFMTIKPKKIFYMAIDGVAPRAKMNQQRSRRFRTALDAEKALQKAIERGDEIPKGEAFDSNSITPGTEFMAKLTKNLKYFIHDKISNDSKWREVEIIFSGHEDPGEGEHKIMNFIRTLRSQKNINENTRHCIYGLDADLIMLSLSVHSPHFALLREEVVFGRRNSSQPNTLENQNFYLLHISLLREYMALEFDEIADEVQFEYNFERVLDDFILIMFVLGNDFLPNLPDLHLNKGAFPVILQTFKEALLHLDGYINDRGQINLKRLKVWVEYLAQFELMNFERNDIDVDWFNQQLENISIEGERKRARVGKKLLIRQQKKIVGMVKPWVLKLANEKIPTNIPDEEIPILNLELEDSMVQQNIEFLKELAFDLGLIVVHSKSRDSYSLKLDLDAIGPHETEENRAERIQYLRKSIKRYQNAVLVEDQEELDKEKEIYNDRFQNWKADYYKRKFKFGSQDENKIVQLTKDYVKGLQWVLYYYYRGCHSWNWYYGYHYAPRIADLEKGLDQLIEFEMGVPFTPFQQLMAVLPERSKNLIPAAFRPLMYEESSPIIDFYPADAELDKNGKTADWEAVVLIPFVDEKRLISAMEPYLHKLTPEEAQRNKFGKPLCFVFNPQVDSFYKSPLSGIFSDIEHDHCVELESTFAPAEGVDTHYGLLPNAKQGKELLAGFPTLKTIPFTAKLEYNESMVFQQPSRQKSMVLHITDIYKENNITMVDVAKRFMNKIVYTRWPYLRESRLSAISDGDNVFEWNSRSKRVVQREADVNERKTFTQLKGSLSRLYGKNKAVSLNGIRNIISVFPVIGLVRKSDGSYKKKFSDQPDYYPLQLMVDNVINKDERYAEKPPVPIEEEHPIGSKAIFLGDYAYGGETTIDGYSNSSRLKITVKKRSLKAEPTIGKERLKQDQAAIVYYPSYEVARILKLNKLFLSKITSRFLITDPTGKNINVGLEIKSEAKHKRALGHAVKSTKGWMYSNLTVNLLKSYKSAFPGFFEKLESAGRDIPSADKLFPELSSKDVMIFFDKLKKWLRENTGNMILVSWESDSLTKTSIAAVEDYIINNSSQLEKIELKHLAKVPREAILDPKTSFALLREQKFELGDRVVYIQDSGKVPLYSRGTVVGYTTLGTTLSIQVLFDKEIVAGNDFGGRLKTKRGLGLDASFLLNVSNPQFIYHSKASKQAMETKQSPKTRSSNRNNERKPKFENVSESNLNAKDLLSHIKKDGREKVRQDTSKSMTKANIGNDNTLKSSAKVNNSRPKMPNSENPQMKQKANKHANSENLRSTQKADSGQTSNTTKAAGKPKIKAHKPSGTKVVVNKDLVSKEIPSLPISENATQHSSTGATTNNPHIPINPADSVFNAVLNQFGSQPAVNNPSINPHTGLPYFVPNPYMPSNVPYYPNGIPTMAMPPIGVPQIGPHSGTLPVQINQDATEALRNVVLNKKQPRD